MPGSRTRWIMPGRTVAQSPPAKGATALSEWWSSGFRGRESGVEVRRELTGVYRLRNGKIASERIYLDREEALEAAGLRE